MILIHKIKTISFFHDFGIEFSELLLLLGEIAESKFFPLQEHELEKILDGKDNTCFLAWNATTGEVFSEFFKDLETLSAFLSHLTDNSSLFPHAKNNKNILNIRSIVLNFNAQRKAQEVHFNEDDIFNHNKRYIVPYDLDPKIELVRRLTKPGDIEQLLIYQNEILFCEQLILLIKEKIHLSESPKWLEFVVYPRIKHLLIHAYLQDRITEDECIDCMAVLDIRYDCVKFGNSYELVELLDPMDKLSTFGIYITESFFFDRYQKMDFLASLKSLKTKGIAIHAWLIDLPKESQYSQLLFSFDQTYNHYILQSGANSKYIVTSSAVYKTLLSIRYGRNTVFSRPSLGRSSFRSIGCGLIEGFRDYAITVDGITSTTNPHGISGFASYNIFHERFHAWKCSTLGAPKRNCFIYLADLFYKIYLLFEHNGNKPFSFGKYVNLDVFDFLDMKQVYEKYSDQEFAKQFGRSPDARDANERDFVRNLLNLSDPLLKIVLLDLSINELYWQEQFDFDLTKLESLALDISKLKGELIQKYMRELLVDDKLKSRFNGFRHQKLSQKYMGVPCSIDLVINFGIYKSDNNPSNTAKIAINTRPPEQHNRSQTSLTKE